MGRTEDRKRERAARIEERKGKVMMSRDDINKIKQNISSDVGEHNVEALMTCFALAEHRLHNFGKRRILRSLNYMNDIMNEVIKDNATIDDYKKQLADETGVVIKCQYTD